MTNQGYVSRNGITDFVEAANAYQITCGESQRVPLSAVPTNPSWDLAMQRVTSSLHSAARLR